MESQIKVGDYFEVVEVLTHGGYSESLLSRGGHTIRLSVSRILTNGLEYYSIRKKELGQYTCAMYYDEVKPIGKLTITKVK